ncbi:hypothetical protein F5883DRAFT_655702 [Diaporthe sp. PMI_573]|nr:hypothetical protein F5883DRAFT_655702 [Diaporthaceae sp. PMI_573]
MTLRDETSRLLSNDIVNPDELLVAFKLSRKHCVANRQGPVPTSILLEVEELGAGGFERGSINAQYQTEKDHDLVTFAEEEKTVRAEANHTLDNHLLLLNQKFDTIATQRLRDYARRIQENATRFVQTGSSASGYAPESSVSESTITYQPGAVSTTVPLPTELKDTKIAWSSPDREEDTPGSTSEPILTTSSPSSSTSYATSNSSYILPDEGQRAIDFDDLYKNGDATEKHMIIQNPVASGWYIFCCEHMHFGSRPMMGALSHLKGGDHSCSPTRKNAIRYLGIYVNNCDAEKAKMNNDVFRKALIDGYKPFTAKKSTPSRRRMMPPRSVIQGIAKTNSPRTPPEYGRAYPSA